MSPEPAVHHDHDIFCILAAAEEKGYDDILFIALDRFDERSAPSGYLIPKPSDGGQVTFFDVAGERGQPGAFDQPLVGCELSRREKAEPGGGDAPGCGRRRCPSGWAG